MSYMCQGFVEYFPNEQIQQNPVPSWKQMSKFLICVCQAKLDGTELIQRWWFACGFDAYVHLRYVEWGGELQISAVL